MTKKGLNRRQARWPGFLTRFDYRIMYGPGKSNGKVDALARRPGDHPERRDERWKNMEQVALKPQNLPEQLRLLANSQPFLGRPSSADLLAEWYLTGLLLGQMMNALQMNSGLHEITIAECIKEAGRIWYRANRYVPESNALHLRIIEGFHDTALTGRLGCAKAFDLLDRQQCWKEMLNNVDRYVWHCHSCQWSWSSIHSTFGMLWPLPVPQKPLDDLSMNFVIGIPECKGFDVIWVEVDRVSTMRQYMPCHTTIDTPGLAEFFLIEVVCVD